MTKERERFESIERAKKCGLTEADAIALRRIALTLHRWFELECGDGNSYGSWAIEREEQWAIERAAWPKDNAARWWDGEKWAERTARRTYSEYEKSQFVVKPLGYANSVVPTTGEFSFPPHGAWRDTGAFPYLVHHHYLHGQGKDYITRTKLPDRETGARKRLDKLMAKYPDWRAWIQTDPRGGTIYLCKPEDATDSLYTRGIFIA